MEERLQSNDSVLPQVENLAVGLWIGVNGLCYTVDSPDTTMAGRQVGAGKVGIACRPSYGAGNAGLGRGVNVRTLLCCAPSTSRRLDATFKCTDADGYRHVSYYQTAGSLGV